MVSSDFSGTVYVWDMESSVRVFRYLTDSDCKVTSLNFDTSQRRVITGCDNGKLKIWNFSSGQCLTEFRDHGLNKAHWRNDPVSNKCKGTEITGVVYVMEVALWNCSEVQTWIESFRDKVIYFFPYFCFFFILR